jgi:1-phosphofructokinase family hexose kinase
MILTVTLNPAIDTTYIIPGFTADGIFNSSESFRVAGGKGINVARVLKFWGHDVITTGFLGGANGAFISQQLVNESIQSNFVLIQHETRQNIAICDSVTGHVAKINEYGPRISLQEIQQLIDRFRSLVEESEFIVLSGSCPPGVPSDIYSTLIHIAHDASVPVALDACGIYLEKGISAKPFVIKPNLNELLDLTGTSVSTNHEIADLANKVCVSGVQWVLVTLGEKGSILCHQDRCWFATTPDVRCISTVGSGDTYLGTWIHGYLSHLSVEECARISSAAGAANAMGIGSGTLEKADLETLIHQVEVHLL